MLSFCLHHLKGVTFRSLVGNSYQLFLSHGIRQVEAGILCWRIHAQNYSRLIMVNVSS